MAKKTVSNRASAHDQTLTPIVTEQTADGLVFKRGLVVLATIGTTGDFQPSGELKLADGKSVSDELGKIEVKP